MKLMSYLIILLFNFNLLSNSLNELFGKYGATNDIIFLHQAWEYFSKKIVPQLNQSELKDMLQRFDIYAGDLNSSDREEFDILYKSIGSDGFIK